MASSYEIKRTVRSVLVINPNTSKSMTDALKPLIESLGYDKVCRPLIFLPLVFWHVLDVTILRGKSVAVTCIFPRLVVSLQIWTSPTSDRKLNEYVDDIYVLHLRLWYREYQ